MKVLFNILFVLQFSFLFSQSGDTLDFNFYNASNKLYVIGEGHFQNDGPLQSSIINYIHKNTSINVVIFEVSSEVGKIYNNYILEGIGESDIDIINSAMSKQVAKKTKLILAQLREYNLSGSNKIEAKGIDLFSYYKLKRQVRVLSIIFPELKQINLPLVDRYIVKQKVRNYNRKKSLSLINSLLDELNQNQVIFNQFLNTRKEIYDEYLTNLKFEYSDYSWRESDSIREKFLSENLMKIVDSNTVCVMLCGGTHALYKTNDDWYYGYPYSSMTSIIKNKYPNQVYSIIIQYYEKKIFHFFSDFNLLNYPMKDYLENNPVPYLIFDKKDIEEHKTASERCDMVIIQNTQYRSEK